MYIFIVKSFPDDQNEIDLAVTNERENSTIEKRASNVLQYHYSNLSKAILHPSVVAQALYSKEMITHSTMTVVQSSKQSLSESKAVLLKAVRNGISHNHCNLKILIDALEECECIKMASVLQEDYRKWEVFACFSISGVQYRKSTCSK